MQSPESRIDAYIARQQARALPPCPKALAAYLRTLPRGEQRALLAMLTRDYPHLPLAAIARNLPALTLPVANTYTTAPPEYDGFGSETIAVVGTLAGKPVRQVETPVEHIEWQRQRYGSGLYPAYTLREFMDLIAYPWAQYVAAPETLA
jgi:hypothetical protein